MGQPPLFFFSLLCTTVHGIILQSVTGSPDPSYEDAIHACVRMCMKDTSCVDLMVGRNESCIVNKLWMMEADRAEVVVHYKKFAEGSCPYDYLGTPKSTMTTPAPFTTGDTSSTTSLTSTVQSSTTPSSTISPSSVGSTSPPPTTRGPTKIGIVTVKAPVEYSRRVVYDYSSEKDTPPEWYTATSLMISVYINCTLTIQEKGNTPRVFEGGKLYQSVPVKELLAIFGKCY